LKQIEKRELKSFNDISDYYDIKKRLVVDLNHLSKIGASSLTDSKIIKDIISNSKVPQTTAYRKIEKMKKLGLLVEDGFILSPLKKQIIKYTSPFESFSIIHENNKSVIKYGPKKNE